MQHKFSRKVLIHFIGCIIISLTINSCKSLDKYYTSNLNSAPFDAVIVPGVPFNNGSWDTIMKGRVLWSMYLYQQGITKNIIYSGSSVYSPFIEGKIMALYAEQLGINPKNIFVEPQAEHSTENVYYGFRLGEKQNFKTIALASDRFQSRMLLSYIRKLKRKFDADIKCLPMQIDILKTVHQDDIQIDSMQAYVKDYQSIMERESFWKRFRGTMGKNIDYKN